MHAFVLDKYTLNERLAGRISGPFSSPPHPQFIVSPLGVVPKKELGAFQVIHDFSYPKGWVVNDLIPQDLTSVVDEDLDHVSALALSKGQGALTAKVDIQAAFCILPIHPVDRHLLGFTWQGQFYFYFTPFLVHFFKLFHQRCKRLYYYLMVSLVCRISSMISSLSARLVQVYVSGSCNSLYASLPSWAFQLNHLKQFFLLQWL